MGSIIVHVQGGAPGVPPLIPLYPLSLPPTINYWLCIGQKDHKLSSQSVYNQLPPVSFSKLHTHEEDHKSHRPQPINIDSDEFELIANIHHPTSSNEFSCFQELAHVFQ